MIGSAGFVGRHRKELPGPDEELGYALHPDFWGRGLMTEAARELIRWGFEELGLSTIWCNHYDGNERSHRVIEKCGFRYDGNLRRAFLRYDGAVLDDVLYSMTRDEFYALYGL